jgi:hypothetical protein
MLSLNVVFYVALFLDVLTRPYLLDITETIPIAV